MTRNNPDTGTADALAPDDDLSRHFAKPALSLVVSGCHVNFWISTILIPYETARPLR
jgi:hypothetical protein